MTKTEDDSGPCLAADCALREAVLAANASPGMDVIEVPAGEYVLSLAGSGPTGGDLDIRDDTEIAGVPGETVIRATESRVFVIRGRLNVHTIDVQISGLEITGGTADLGGGISGSVANIKLTDCWVNGNVSSIDGGGIYYAVASLNLHRTTVSGNEAGRHGGGIRRSNVDVGNDTGSLLVQNSTISGNSAAFHGGAVFSFGDGGAIRIENSTLVDNQAGVWGDLIMQDISIGPQFLNSVLEGDCFFIGSAFPMSLGGNVGKDTDFCFLDQPSDQADVFDLGVTSLGAFGGPTPTHALSEASPAVDTALLAYCPAEDQRGESRPAYGGCDAGAVELQPATAVAIPMLGPGQLFLLTCLLVAGAVLTISRHPESRKVNVGQQE